MSPKATRFVTGLTMLVLPLMVRVTGPTPLLAFWMSLPIVGIGLMIYAFCRKDESAQASQAVRFNCPTCQRTRVGTIDLDRASITCKACRQPCLAAV